MPTKIEWADETWNPITGCTKVSEGCRNCYAERMARRLAGRYGYPEAPRHFDVTVHEDKIEQPLRWKKPRRVFVCSMGDLFHPGLDIIDSTARRDVFTVMALAHRHTFLLLTKRPEVARLTLTDELGDSVRWAAMPGDGLAFPELADWRERPFRWPLPNVLLGVTVESQAYTWRIGELLKIPAAGHFVSLEPLLGPVDLTGKPQCGWGAYGAYPEDTLWPNSLTGMTFSNDGSIIARGGPKLDWVILGGESGPGARPDDEEWYRAVRDQCQEAGVSFFMKQMARKAPIPADLMIREMPYATKTGN